MGQKKANELGLFDMTGNLVEWCFKNDISYDPTDSTKTYYENYIKPTDFQFYRGGNLSSLASFQYYSITSEQFAKLTSRNDGLGFRVARSYIRDK